jgi:hypothetical protein
MSDAPQLREHGASTERREYSENTVRVQSDENIARVRERKTQHNNSQRLNRVGILDVQAVRLDHAVLAVELHHQARVSEVQPQLAARHCLVLTDVRV